MKYDNRVASFCVLFVFLALIADTYIVSYSSFTWSAQGFSFDMFIIISLVFILGQYFLLNFIKVKSEEIRIKGKTLHIIHKLVTVAIYLILAIFVFTILQMLFLSKYNLTGVVFALSISYLVAITMMILLAYRFLSWFKINRNYLILLYGISAAALCINSSISLSIIIITSSHLPVEILPLAGSFRFGNPLSELLNSVFNISSIVSFVTTWSATALLLRHYSRRSIIYWIIVGAPLVYFLGQFLYLFLNPFSILSSDAFNFGVLLMTMFLLSKPVGGVLFGFAFWVAVRRLNRGPVKNYMVISAFGLILFFMSNQAASTFPVISYPPFGLATSLFVGLSSYYIMLGIYSSAVSISEDTELRRSIRRLALKEHSLLDGIGTANMQQKIEERVWEIAKKNEEKMLEQTGIEPSLDESDMREYLNTVIKEVQQHHVDNSTH
jgi:hypothetical protein